MKTRNAIAAALLSAAALACGSAHAQNATKDEAVAMVKKGIAFIKANGKEKGLAEISNPQGQFRVRDLYLTVNTLDGTVLAHGSNPKMVNLQLMDVKDIDGKPYMRERMDMARIKPSFWQDMKFTNPVSKLIEPKTIYCERSDDILLCGGVYK